MDVSELAEALGVNKKQAFVCIQNLRLECKVETLREYAAKTASTKEIRRTMYRATTGEVVASLLDVFWQKVLSPNRYDEECYE